MKRNKRVFYKKEVKMKARKPTLKALAPYRYPTQTPFLKLS